MVISKEKEFLKYCANPIINTQTFKTMKILLTDNLNWSFIIDYAYHHGITPLLYYNLKRIGSLNHIPYEMMKKIEESYNMNSIHNFLLNKELAEILKLFEDNNINVILLKGAALFKLIPKYEAIRTMSDIDLLVKEKDIGIAIDLMGKLKYISCVPWKLDKERETLLEYDAEIPFSNGKICAEIHWCLIPNKIYKLTTKIDMDKIWEESLPTHINDIKTLILSPENLLLHLCLHLSVSHTFSGLKWHRDISEVINYYNDKINWDEIIEKSNEWNIRKAVYYTLYFSKELFNTPIPNTVLGKLSSDRFKFILKPIFKEHIFYKNSQKSLIKSSREYILKFFVYDMLSQIFLIDNFRNIFDKKMIRFIFPSVNLLKVIYPISISKKFCFLFYMFHFCILFTTLIILVTHICITFFKTSTFKSYAYMVNYAKMIKIRTKLCAENPREVNEE